MKTKSDNRFMTGRPSVFTPEIAAEICERIAMDESLIKICESDHMPSTNTVYRWLNDDDKQGFRDDYVRARGNQAHTVADQAKKVREDLLAGLIDHQTANALLNFIKWETGKRNPKSYGDKQTLEHTGADGGPIQSQATIKVTEAPPEVLEWLASQEVE